MTCLWLIMQFITICCVYNLAKEQDDVLGIDDLNPLIEQETSQDRTSYRRM